MQTFREKVYILTQQIPKGKVATYGQLAALAGNPKAARAVGMCMRTNPDSTRIPCHRVVASDGKLTGYKFGNGISTKEKLLRTEGVIIENGRVDVTHSGWKFNAPVSLSK